MHRSSDFIDESSRLKQFAWEQWDNQVIAVIFRPGDYGLDRYVVKRYIEQVLFQSERWKQLSSYFSSISPLVRAYPLTSYEVELMRRILDFHLSDRLHLRITQTNDQLIGYEEFLDFISRAQEFYGKNSNSHNNIHSINGKKPSIPSIPSIHSAYILPSLAKSIICPLPQSTTIKTSSVQPPPPPPLITIASSSPQSNNTQGSTSVTNGHHISQSSINPSSRLTTTVQVKSNHTSNQSNRLISSELCPISLYNAKIEGHGWVQINNVYLPFIIKNHQRLVPYQVLVSCKILEPDELRSTLTRATTSDITLINSMVRDCKINNEQLPENTSLINVYHVLIGTKNLVYVKILPKDNPTSTINRQYKSVLALRGGSLYIAARIVPFVCSSNHSYMPLNLLNIYPNLHIQLQNLARAPRTTEFDYLQLVQMYYNEKELPLDTLLIDIEELNQRQIIPSKNLTLIEYHAKEKTKLEQQISLLINNNNSTNKRKNIESHENKQVQQRLKLSTPLNQFRPPTGYFPASSQNQQNHWLSSNNGHRGRTRWQ